MTDLKTNTPTMVYNTMAYSIIFHKTGQHIM